MKNRVLVTGVTGRQGGEVAHRLQVLGGYKVVGMTRQPNGPVATRLMNEGIEIIAGDFNDASSLENALRGCWGAFSVQNTWESGVEKEEEQAHRFARLALSLGVSHFVYSSVASANRCTGIPHFENKHRVEQVIANMGFQSHVIIRPAFFMENMRTFFPPNEAGDIVMAMDSNVPLQMVSVSDIGKYGALAFNEYEKLNGKAIDIAGDALTIPTAASILAEADGYPRQHVRADIEAVRAYNGDMATMFEWFNSTGYDVEIPMLEARYGIKPKSFREWAMPASAQTEEVPEMAETMAAAAVPHYPA